VSPYSNSLFKEARDQVQHTPIKDEKRKEKMSTKKKITTDFGSIN
jgi:hypothetical protein